MAGYHSWNQTRLWDGAGPLGRGPGRVPEDSEQVLEIPFLNRCTFPHPGWEEGRGRGRAMGFEWGRRPFQTPQQQTGLH